MARRVQDVSGDYEGTGRPARDAEISAIKSKAQSLKTGRLERDIDAVLRAKGLSLDEPLATTVRGLRAARGRDGKRLG